MTRGKLLTAAFVAALTVGATPAWAQRGSAERSDPDSRPSGPDRVGTAVERPSSGGGSPAGSGGSSGSAGGGGSSVSSGGGSGWSAPPSASSPSNSTGREYARAPERPSRNAEREQGRARSGAGDSRRPTGGGSNAGSARPRGTDDEHVVGAGTSRSAAAASAGDSAPSRRAVPTYSRPRDGRQPTGTAVERTYPYTGNNTNLSGYYSYPYYSPYYSSYRGYYVPGYGFGLGYYYDPFWYDPYYYGGLGSGAYAGGYGAYGGGYQGGYGSSSYGNAPTGNLRLKLKPRDAQVFVDGYFVGIVDSFDGLFQKLGIDAGGHRIEVKAPGFETIQFDVLITPGETVTYKGELRRIP